MGIKKHFYFYLFIPAILQVFFTGTALAKLPKGSYQVAQMRSPQPGRLITPQQRRIPVNWFRKPFGQMYKEKLREELEKTQSSMAPIKVPPNLTPLARTLNFSAYSLANSLGMRRERILMDPGATARLSLWYYLRQREYSRIRWWESNLRAVIIRGMVFQPRFEGMMSKGAISRGEMGSGETYVDDMRRKFVKTSKVPTPVPASSTIAPMPPMPSEPKSSVNPMEPSPSKPSILRQERKPNPAGDIGPKSHIPQAPPPPPSFDENIYTGPFFNETFKD